MHRPRPYPDGTWHENQRKTPAYFHVTDLACVHEVEEFKACKIGKGDIYMENKVYFELTTKHIKYLQQLEHWNFIKMHAAMLNNRDTNIAYMYGTISNQHQGQYSRSQIGLIKISPI